MVKIRQWSVLIKITFTLIFVYSSFNYFATIHKNTPKTVTFTEISSRTSHISCSEIIKLPKITESQIPENPIFFIETSKRPYLLTRQACAIESAVKYSGRTPVLLMWSPNLNPSENNQTCQILKLGGVQIFTFDFNEMVKDTPLEHVLPELERNKAVVMHASDMLRQIVVFKYGGMYLDLDFVIMKDMSTFHNSLSITNMKREMEAVFEKNETCDPRGSMETSGSHIQNAYTALEKGHPVTLKLIENLANKYTRNVSRFETGPLLITRTVQEVYQQSFKKLQPSPEFSLLPTYFLYPIGANRARQDLWRNEPISSKDWDRLFECSYAVHFYNYLSEKWPVKRLPNREAYAYLGEKFCPLSYWSAQNF